MAIVFYKNEFLDDSKPLLTAENRAFKYGDGLFESMVAFDGVVPLLPYHYERLQRSCEILGMRPEEGFNFDSFKEIIALLLHKNGFENARIRVQVSRAGGGLYLPLSNDIEMYIQCTEILHREFEWSALKVDFSPYRVDMGVLSNLKTTSKIQYVMSALHAQKVGAQECFLFNVKGNLAEAINSNVFIVSGDSILTPALTNGGVNGVMRRFLLSQLSKNYNVVQTDVQMQDLDEADEIFLTNAVRGIQSVAVVGSVIYSDNVTRQIFDHVNDSIRGIITESKPAKTK